MLMEPCPLTWITSGVEDELVEREEAVLRRELGDRAAHITLLAIVQQERARDVDAQQFGEGLADLSLGHDHHE